MKAFVLGAILTLMSAASMADTSSNVNTPSPTSDATSPATAPPNGNAPKQRAGKKGPANSCSRNAFGTCKGCSITCPEGQAAICSDSLYNWNSNGCVRDAACTCKARKK